jgi:hypothetical protein
MNQEFEQYHDIVPERTHEDFQNGYHARMDNVKDRFHEYVDIDLDDDDESLLHAPCQTCEKNRCLNCGFCHNEGCENYHCEIEIECILLNRD